MENISAFITKITRKLKPVYTQVITDFPEKPIL